MGTFLRGLPQYLQLLGVWGYASVCDGWNSLVGVTALPRRFFKPLCSFLGRQKDTFLALVNHNLSCSLAVNHTSTDSGHGVTCDTHASFIEVIKAYTSHLKSKKEKGSLTSKGGQASRYVEQFYQVWDEYFWMAPESSVQFSRSVVSDFL